MQGGLGWVSLFLPRCRQLPLVSKESLFQYKEGLSYLLKDVEIPSYYFGVSKINHIFAIDI